MIAVWLVIAAVLFIPIARTHYRGQSPCADVFSATFVAALCSLGWPVVLVFVLILGFLSLISFLLYFGLKYTVFFGLEEK
jgi:hypothetical protein